MKALLKHTYGREQSIVEGDFTEDELNQKIYYLQFIEASLPSNTLIGDALWPVECGMLLEQVFGFKSQDVSSKTTEVDFTIDMYNNWEYHGYSSFSEFRNWLLEFHSNNGSTPEERIQFIVDNHHTNEAIIKMVSNRLKNLQRNSPNGEGSSLMAYNNVQKALIEQDTSISWVSWTGEQGCTIKNFFFTGLQP